MSWRQRDNTFIVGDNHHTIPLKGLYHENEMDWALVLAFVGCKPS
jgi:hypothetical protein